MPRICVYAIAKNEDWCVERFLDSAQEADEILIADTGSTDSTVQKVWAWAAKQNHIGVRCISIYVAPWRFDVARDTALAMMPKDIDICVSLDLDEVLCDGWRAKLEAAWVPGTTRARYQFDWGCGIAFMYDKIHARKGYRWKNPIHEFPIPYGIEEKYCEVDPDFLMVIHKPNGKGRPDYLPMLKMSIEEDPLEPRNAFYYARELSFYNQYEEAIVQCERYLALPGATWRNERCYAYRVAAECATALGRMDDACGFWKKAIEEAPHTREPWIGLADYRYRLGNWHLVLNAIGEANKITEREKVYTMDPTVWTWKPHLYASIAYWHLELKKEALQHALKAVEFSPNDPLLLNNVEAIRKTM